MSDVPQRLSAALVDRYRIERELGAGGMATVYLAADLKHDRKVAIKVLKPELAAVLGAERFVQEIKTTAALSHPHILPLFDSGEAGGFLYYVMPYLQGETIREKLNRETQFGIEEAVKITTEVAEALDYAHQNGVIHRDIKPENILLHAGRPMVMDFGIALAVSAAAGGRMTETGLSLGTPHYMSPEQATADKQITARSDIYSLASVLYEMLAGEPPHTGGSAQAIIMKIIAERAQPVTELRGSVPPNVAAALGKALEKLPADRFDTARAFCDALATVAFSGGTGVMAAERLGARGSPWWVPVGAAALGLVVGAVGLRLLHTEPEPPVVRFTLELAPGHRLDPQSDGDAAFAISPDGMRIAYVSIDSATRQRQLWVRAVDQLQAIALAGPTDPTAPFFSPDGLWIGYVNEQDRALMKLPVTGGPSIKLADNVRAGLAGGSWADDHWIYYTSSPRTTISRVRDTGGIPELLVEGDTLGGTAYPVALPGGKSILASHCSVMGCSDIGVAVLDLDTRQYRPLVPGAVRAWYSETGHLIYSTDLGQIFAVPFDADRGELRGGAVPLIDEVQTSNDGARFTISRSGAMAYLPGRGTSGVQVVDVDRTGRETVLLADPGDYDQPRWSPTRDRIALTVAQEGGSQIWIYTVADRTLAPLTREGRNYRSSWSPDGRRISFVSERGDTTGIYAMPADGSRDPEPASTTEQTGGTTSWTRDGDWIVFDGPWEKDDEDIFAIGMGSDRSRKVVVATPERDESGTVSPDGRWVAYVVTEGTRSQVWVRPFLRDGGRWLISTGSGHAPLWASNTELTFVDPVTRSLVSAQLAFDPDPRIVRRTPLVDMSTYRLGSRSVPDHDISRDGQHILVLRDPGGAGAAVGPIVVLNWAQELRSRMSAQGGR